ncbi:filamentous hemagglutinin family N-terminal domain protein [Rivularia sp. PCC 7116]|uniref:two-partner secretion domain-containing protein n=1 Tax=Rivularia sp. PCC 7116 TaxID=373994 RepID=UPI00029F0096|nr:filamentous hemagglutinin N-terminal domain-containing protein [Rivularia sp. PCC 7116]AFY55265.1 filamentous hemagglutinin family N-terminal domain protein [Rivularia sp. PCC 7116]
MFNHQAIFLGLALAFAFTQVRQAKAQLIPDNTFGKENSLVNSINSLEDRIDGGAIRGSNLFHSFEEFNIGNNRSVYFNNPTAIQNILTRVTGNNASQILGKLGVLGNANLFLINPNGIIFGKDASLDINGSFVGSTASFINFTDGTEFSAVSPEKPLLTISTPIGLGMGNNPGEIRVQGDGHSIVGDGLEFPFVDSSTKGLEVAPGKTIALIGGNIVLEGGLLKTKFGRIELASVASGKVNFTPNLQLSYDNAQSFQDIKLSQEALLDATNSLQNPSDTGNSINQNFADAGSINIKAKKISLTGNSYILLQNQVNIENLPPGTINIDATESLEINDSVIRTQSFLTGKGGDIKVKTKLLMMKDSGIITVSNYGLNSGGDINIEASDSIEIIGSSILDRAPSSITTIAFNSGDGGNINTSTNKLKLIDGGIISSTTFNSGNTGNLTINAREFVKVIGLGSSFTGASFLSSLTLGSGDGGNLTLNTQRLTVKDGGRVDASTGNSGAAGSITINASDKVELAGSGTIREVVIPSLITSSADIADKSLQEILGIPVILNGDSGTVTINTNQLNIADGALLAVKNDGSGNAGKLQVKADSISIKNRGNINATTASGRGGDINLQTQNLLLRDNSNISATAGDGDGGNINIDTQVLAALQNSDISANSEGSFGGKVAINAKGIFGTQFREFLTPESDITATSGKGGEFNGVVDINTITINPNFRLAELPTGLTNSSQQIVAGCSASRASNFTIVGRGGLPESPNQLFTGNIPTVDLLDLIPTSKNMSNDIYYRSSSNSNNNFIHQNKKEIVEAKGWITDTQGNIEFVAKVPRVINNSRGIKAVDCQSLVS